MKPLTILLALCQFSVIAVSSPTPSTPSIRKIFTFPINSFTENILARSNSHLLLTTLTSPDLYIVNPTIASPTASVIHSFPNGTGISGITEYAPDKFALITGIWDLANTRATNLSIWTVNLASRTPIVHFVTGVQNTTVLNGLASIPENPDLVFAADSAAGAVWKINLLTGSHSIVVSSSLLLPINNQQGSNLGINGLKGTNGYLYFTNSAEGIFGRISISSSGKQKGEIKVLSHVADAVAGGVYDDFTIPRGGKVWIATHPASAIKVTISGNGVATQEAVTNQTILFNPTSAAYGRGSRKEENTVYVTNGGRFVDNGNGGFDLVDSGVVALTL